MASSVLLLFSIFSFTNLMIIMAFQQSIDDLSFHTSTLIESTLSNDLFELDHHSSTWNNYSNCQEIWCETQSNPYNNYYEDMNYFDDNVGFWLEPPPDDIVFIPPPPMPLALQSFFNAVGNETMREFIIGEDPIEGIRCNFCKMFADSKIYQDDDGIGSSMFNPSSSSTSKNTEPFIPLLYGLIISFVIVIICIVCLLIRYKKFRILSNHIWSSSNGVIAHHKSSSSSSSASPSDTCLSPVVNEKSPQSIIMDASLASLGKKSTISTTGKYWKRVPNNGNILFMEDRRGLRSIGGSSTGISDHPYSDAASCTSSPVYAELDPAVAAACNQSNQPMIGPLIGRSFGTQVYGGGGYSSSNTYTEVPEGIGHRNRHHLNSGHHAISTNLLSDSSTYDNAAYLSASSQQFLQSSGYNPRSLRRLAAQRSAAMNAATASNQISTPLLSNQQYPPYNPTAVQQQQHRQGFFPTGGRSIKKNRNNHNNNNNLQSGVNYYRYGQTITSRPSMMNHYVSNNHETTMLTNETDLSSIIGSNENDITLFNSFMMNNSNGLEMMGKSSTSSSSQYTEMPLIPASSTFGSNMNNAYRSTAMSETHSNNDLNSAASSSASTTHSGEHQQQQRNHNNKNITSTNSSSLTGSSSSTSIKRPLPPVPDGNNASSSIQL